MTPKIVQLHDLPDLVGQSFTSQGFTLTREDVQRFEDVTGVTEIYSQTRPLEYDEGMVEGFHSLSLLDLLLSRVLRPDPRTCYSLNYGFEHVRFPARITADQPLNFSCTVNDASPRGNGFLMIYQCSLQHQESTRPGLVADWLVFTQPRERTEYQY